MFRDKKSTANSIPIENINTYFCTEHRHSTLKYFGRIIEDDHIQLASPKCTWITSVIKYDKACYCQ